MLVTFEEIKNALDIDLPARLHKSISAAEHWLERQEDIVISHIAEYAFYKYAQTEKYLQDEQKKEVIKKSIIEQVDYVLTSAVDVTKIIPVASRAGSFSALNKQSLDGYEIAPLAHKLLLENGLLYTGRN